MNRQMRGSKIHRARITDSDLHYVGSITIDRELLEASDILEHELVHVLDLDNGARFGDTIIVVSYASYDEQELEAYEPTVVHVNSNDEIIDVNSNVDLLEVAS